MTTLAAAILAGYTLPSLAQSDPFIEKVLNEHYPEDAQATADYRNAMANEENMRNAVCHYRPATVEEVARDNDNPDEGFINKGSRFCMRFHSEKVIDGAQGKRRYLLFIGDNINQARYDGGLVSLMLFKIDGDGWTLVDKKETGASGYNSEWQWLEFAPGRWGVYGGDSHDGMGYAFTYTRILRDDNDRIREQGITTANDNSGSYGFCENEEKSEEERAACRKDIQNLSATLTTRPDLGAAKALTRLKSASAVKLKAAKNNITTSLLSLSTTAKTTATSAPKDIQWRQNSDFCIAPRCTSRSKKTA